MSSLPCDKEVSSGITRPFGRLSQSPGYVSDTLLTRSPLGLAAPCDLHVLATPPAFRLSQDQTLQLNFLARAVPDARRRPFGLAETDTFTARVYPRNEFVQTDRVKTLLGQLLLPPCRLGRGGQSNGFVLAGGSPRCFNRPTRARLKHFFWLPRCDPGLLTTKLIKEDHLHCVHHKDV